MTWVKGYTPWNKGRKAPLTSCERHGVLRVRRRRVTPNRGARHVTYCPRCQDEKKRDWNRAHPGELKGYRRKNRKKKARAA